MDEATKSYMHKQEMRKKGLPLSFTVLTTIAGSEQTESFQNHMAEIMISGFNSMNDLFTNHLERRDRKHIGLLLWIMGLTYSVVSRRDRGRLARARGRPT